MQLEARVLVQPGLHLGRLVGGVVVEHQMHIAPRGHSLVDLSQEAQELLGTMARHAFADDRARFHVQRGEQCGRAMALVIVGHGRGAALLERQARLGPVERLDLGLFIDAEHDRAIRRVEVEPDDIGDLSPRTSGRSRP